jgi:hypothetical protein
VARSELDQRRAVQDPLARTWIAFALATNRWAASGDDPVGREFYLDAALVRARELVDFLDGSDPNHVRAEDFLSGWQAPTHLPSYWRRISCRFSQLRWERLVQRAPGTPLEPAWFLAADFDRLLVDFERFVTAVERSGVDDSGAFMGETIGPLLRSVVADVRSVRTGRST